MQALIAELETAAEGSRGLDHTIFLATHPEQGTTGADGEYWFAMHEDEDGGPWQLVPAYTTSLDAALMLVPERDGSNKAAFLHAAMWQLHIGDISDVRLALIICIASLRARQAIKGDA